MRAYLLTTGSIFALLVVTHVVRGVVESHLLRDPFFVVMTVLAAALAGWAFHLLRRCAGDATPPR